MVATAATTTQGGARTARICAPVTPAVQQAYESQVLPALVALVVAWWLDYDASDKATWHVIASVADGICIDAPDDDAYDTICCPRDLSDATLLIGWQQYRNASIVDPKREIAERMIAALLAAPAVFADQIEIEELDDVAEDIGLYVRTRGYVSESEEERVREQREDDEDEAARETTAHTRWRAEREEINANARRESPSHAYASSSNSNDTDSSEEND